MNPTLNATQNNNSHIDPLIKKPGLTYGRAVQNLTDQIKDIRTRNNSITISVAIVVGIAVSIATLVGAILLLSSIKYEDVEGKKYRQPAPGEDWKLPLGLTFANVTMMIPGLIVGGIIMGIGYGISELTLSMASRTHQTFSEVFEENACIENDDLVATLNNCNEARQRTMIQEMNFQQLTTTRNVLGKKKFGQLIEGSTKEQYQLWKEILEMSSDLSNKKILKKLQSPAILALIQTRPLFSAQLRRHLRKRNDLEIISLLKPSPFQKLSNINVTFKCDENSIEVPRELIEKKKQDFEKLLREIKSDVLEYTIPAEKYEELTNLIINLTTITINCDGKDPIIANKWLLEQRCAFFKDLFKNDNEITIPHEKHNTYSLLIDAFTNDNFDWNLNNALELFDIAVELKNQPILNFIENSLLNNRALLDKDDLLNKYSPYLPTLKSVLDSNECKIKIDNNNWNEIKEKAAKHALPDLLQKCKKYALEKAIEAVKVADPDQLIWLDKCLELEFLCKDSLSDIKIHLATHTTLKNFSKVYTFAHKEKKAEYIKGDSDLQKACFEFINANAKVIVQKSIESKFYKDILLKLNDKDYQEFSISLQSQINLESISPILAWAEEKKDGDLTNKCLDFVKDNKAAVLEKNIWKFENTPKSVTDILYPYHAPIDPWKSSRK